MLKRLLYTFIFLFPFSFFLSAQVYYDSDPFYLFQYERTLFENNEKSNSLNFRPIFRLKNNDIRWSIRLRSEKFYNSSAPNLENTSVRWVGKGEAVYNAFNLGYVGDRLAFTLEPFQFRSENLDYTEPIRKSMYTRLNDTRPHNSSPYLTSGIREYQLYFHQKGFAIGISNANMWWGAGLHSSLQMTNNTTGFRYFMVGTLEPYVIKQFSINLRYLFSKMDKRNHGEPFFTALLFETSYLSNPRLSIGFSRSYLSGGGGRPDYISQYDAMIQPFEVLFLNAKQTDPNNPESSVDIWDQILVGYLTAIFPSSGLKIYVEYGRDDHAWDWDDFKRQPDHSGAGVFGLRKYGLFGKENLVGGLEHTNLIKSKFWTKRIPGTWYEKYWYDFNSYDGRRWVAHSGSDSDDFYIYFGYMGEKFSIIPAFNYERHGVIDNAALVMEKRPYLVYNPDTGRWEAQIVEQWREKQVNIWPEVKIEFRLDIRYRFKGFDFNFYYEDEVVDNLEFNWGERRGEVWWIGIEKTIDSEDFWAFRKRKLR